MYVDKCYVEESCDRIPKRCKCHRANNGKLALGLLTMISLLFVNKHIAVI